MWHSYPLSTSHVDMLCHSYRSDDVLQVPRVLGGHLCTRYSAEYIKSSDIIHKFVRGRGISSLISEIPVCLSFRIGGLT